VSLNHFEVMGFVLFLCPPPFTSTEANCTAHGIAPRAGG
jgi:hypothetical protein